MVSVKKRKVITVKIIYMYKNRVVCPVQRIFIEIKGSGTLHDLGKNTAAGALQILRTQLHQQPAHSGIDVDSFEGQR